MAPGVQMKHSRTLNGVRNVTISGILPFFQVSTKVNFK
jgi:hypothetical protein